jgi:6-phosphofructokinase 1
MNAFIRSVTRSVLQMAPDTEVCGVLDGWRGLLDAKYRSLTALDTAGISRLGGTVLGTIRLPELRTNIEMQRRVMQNVVDAKLDALFICGGNGSMFAANDLNVMLRANGTPCRIYFTPASIDNDVANTYCTSIGFYSAMERSMEMMDWIRDTASAHRRVYVIGSMGRNSAYLSFYSGIAAGAEYVIRPNEKVDFEAMAEMIERRDRDTRIIVSEGYPQSLHAIEAILNEALGRRHSQHEIRTVDMGYFQRGGEASVTDVLRANWLGHHMVKAMIANDPSCFFGAFHVARAPHPGPLEVVVKPSANHDDIPREVIDMALALR